MSAAHIGGKVLATKEEVKAKYNRRFDRLVAHMDKQGYIVTLNTSFSNGDALIENYATINVGPKNTVWNMVRIPYDTRDPAEKVWAAILACRGAITKREAEAEPDLSI